MALIDQMAPVEPNIKEQQYFTQTTDFSKLTQVRSPEELKGLTEEQIVRDPNSDKIFLATTPPAAKFDIEPVDPNVNPAAGQDLAEGLVANTNAIDTLNETTAANAANAIEGNIITAREQQQQVTAANLETAKAEEEKQKLGFETTKFDAEAEDARLREKFQVAEVEKVLSSVKTEMAELQNEINLENEAIGNKPILGSLIRGQKAMAQRQTQLKMQTLLMKADIAQGNVDSANSRVDRMMGFIQQSTADEKNTYETLLGLAANKTINLTNEEKSQVEAQMAQAQKQSDMIEEHKADIQNMQLNNGSAFVRAGIDLATDDYDTIVSKMGTAVATQGIIDGLVDRYPDAGITLTDSIQSAEQKIKSNSNIYAQSTRLAGGTGTADTGDGTILSDAGELAEYLVGLGTGLTDEVYKANLNLFIQDWVDAGLEPEEAQSLLNQEMGKLRGGTDTTGSSFEEAPISETQALGSSFGEASGIAPLTRGAGQAVGGIVKAAPALASDFGGFVKGVFTGK